GGGPGEGGPPLSLCRAGGRGRAVGSRCRAAEQRARGRVRGPDPLPALGALGQPLVSPRPWGRFVGSGPGGPCLGLWAGGCWGSGVGVLGRCRGGLWAEPRGWSGGFGSPPLLGVGVAGSGPFGSIVSPVWAGGAGPGEPEGAEAAGLGSPRESRGWGEEGREPRSVESGAGRWRSWGTPGRLEGGAGRGRSPGRLQGGSRRRGSLGSGDPWDPQDNKVEKAERGNVWEPGPLKQRVRGEGTPGTPKSPGIPKRDPQQPREGRPQKVKVQRPERGNFWEGFFQLNLHILEYSFADSSSFADLWGVLGFFFPKRKCFLFFWSKS
ncbi:uncharacterized protein LOC113980406, partial [Neopelma chrysocephalum]|uniref:uncharacterized protein LOC113980406 n=1 Tax=Neopelma chrysocephalum TaxID=114329 RepID=UPI000FCD20A1